MSRSAPERPSKNAAVVAGSIALVKSQMARLRPESGWKRTLVG
eukprot:CAMPEP_0175968108 /NCGR_PEP_ID=MMETSP0108-20121206/39699_1 /TAXON_ID=195067 ORGANISM="Goniomonas pacifica, Strain CCMP1869" /NCGR_SAMPLE_ID=MMETSP0108 /ASSEMBLY_ACC=CAM_ASM_000204 /LENGTH=42 /DNA_ID= /DNA_START= /DNA_END= /DNA_ORIENTATION=